MSDPIERVEMIVVGRVQGVLELRPSSKLSHSILWVLLRIFRMDLSRWSPRARSMLLKTYKAGAVTATKG